MRSRGHGCQLSRKCDLAVAALLSEPTLKDAAKKVGISDQALRKWLKIPEFAARVQEAQQQVFGHTLRRLQIESGLALDVIVKVLRKKKGGNDGLKVRAALGLLGHGLKSSELHDLAERVRVIQDELAELSKPSDRPHSNGKVNGRARV
jgi:hypothetical protein